MAQRLVDQFTEADRKRVAAAIVESESKTSAEIMPVIAASSGRYDRPEDIVGLWLALLGITAVWLFLPTGTREAGSWDGMPPEAQWAALMGATVVGFIFGAWIGGRVGWLRRLFTPQTDA